MRMAKSGDVSKTVKRARRLLEAIEKHAKDAIKHGVPREVYVSTVADHAASVFDRLTGSGERDADDS